MKKMLAFTKLKYLQFENFKTPTLKFRKENHFNVVSIESSKIFYREEGGM